LTLYRVQVGKNEYQVEVSGSKLKLNGEPLQANLEQLNELGLFLLRRAEGRTELHLRANGHNAFSALAGGRHLVAQVEKARGRLFRRAQSSAGDVNAPMPGLVVAVHAGEGQRVEKGQVVAVLESMKMQMEFKAPIAGRVAKIDVQPGQQVEKGKLMVRVEPVES